MPGGNVAKSISVPTVEQLRGPFLHALGSGRSSGIKTITRAIAKELELSREVRSIPILDERIELVCTQLLQEGLVETPKEGKFKLTEAGKAVLAAGEFGVKAQDDIISAIPALIPSDASTSSVDQQPIVQINVGEVRNNIIVDVVEDAWEVPAGLPALAENEGQEEGVSMLQKVKTLILTFLAKPYAPLALAVVAVVALVILRSPVFGGLAASGSVGTAMFNKRVGRMTASSKLAKVMGMGALIFSLLGIGAAGEPVQAGTTEVAPIPIAIDISENEDYTTGVVRQVAAEEQRQQEEARKAEEEAARKAAEEEAARKAAEEEAARKAAEEEAARRAAEEQARQEQEAAAAAAAAAAEASRSTASDDYEVYITDTGSKYHRGSCRHLKHSKYPIMRSDAIAQGYEPCKVCSPG